MSRGWMEEEISHLSLALTQNLAASTGNWGQEPVFLAVPDWSGVSAWLSWEVGGKEQTWFK